MKRHLSTCHNLAEEDFQDGGLDSLRASRCAENSELLQNRVCKGRRAKIALVCFILMCFMSNFLLRFFSCPARQLPAL